MNQLITRIVSAFAWLVIAAALTFAQEIAPGKGSQSAPNQIRQQAVAPQIGNSGAATPNSSSAPGLAQPAYLTPISGLQGVLAETADGVTLATQSVDERFNPASSVKLATALVALQTFGPEHRFLTSVWASGKIDKNTGTLAGDLIVTGRDPS
ncbi:MAG: D-alanyl-D-alanine carboxypeptidase, partial [Acidobacteriota bacterium]